MYIELYQVCQLGKELMRAEGGVILLVLLQLNSGNR